MHTAPLVALRLPPAFPTCSRPLFTPCNLPPLPPPPPACRRLGPLASTRAGRWRGWPCCTAAARLCRGPKATESWSWWVNQSTCICSWGFLQPEGVGQPLGRCGGCGGCGGCGAGVGWVFAGAAWWCGHHPPPDCQPSPPSSLPPPCPPPALLCLRSRPRPAPACRKAPTCWRWGRYWRRRALRSAAAPRSTDGWRRRWRGPTCPLCCPPRSLALAGGAAAGQRCGAAARAARRAALAAAAARKVGGRGRKGAAGAGAVPAALHMCCACCCVAPPAAYPPPPPSCSPQEAAQQAQASRICQRGGH